MTDQHEVFVTALGAVTPSGSDSSATYHNMLSGESKVREIDRFDTVGFKCRCAAHADSVPVSSAHDRHVELALRAAREAISYAGNPRLDGVIFATAVGAADRQEQRFRRRRQVPASFCFAEATESIAASVSESSLAFTQTTGCTAGLDALGFAFDLVQSGYLSSVLVVASEAPIVPIVLASFDRIHAVSRNPDSSRASRPFHRERDGFVLGEGAAAVLLENEESPRDPACKVLGWSTVCSGFHMTSIRKNGEDIRRAVELALFDASTKPKSIDAIDLHATSTQQNDVAEANAIAAVFGYRTPEIPVMAQKSINGHALGASSLIEFTNAVAVLQHGALIPVANLDHQDPECKVFAPTSAFFGLPRRILKVASGFSGIHTAVVIEAC